MTIINRADLLDAASRAEAAVAWISSVDEGAILEVNRDAATDPISTGWSLRTFWALRPIVAYWTLRPLRPLWTLRTLRALWAC
ncbi:MAG: hypothetical protein LW645_06905 [Verrucomicrobiaceae bacterium]|nr:hypothetical protein [Verrucomicrobiaceae bacterium]